MQSAIKFVQILRQYITKNITAFHNNKDMESEANKMTY